ncbi:hypothetical protein ETW24_05010 [Leisingera sp. NJS204]|nr:hypothetical protein ETW24_05010 [Leisingera sp. NJS204]
MLRQSRPRHGAAIPRAGSCHYKQECRSRKWQKPKRCPIGFFHINIAELQTAEGKLYLFAGIDRTSKFAVIGGGNYGEKGALYYGIEAMHQFGKFQGQDIRAWGVRSQNSYRLSETPLNPTFHLIVNATSGDSDPNDGKLALPKACMKPRRRCGHWWSGSCCRLRRRALAWICPWRGEQPHLSGPV